jgi:outer membrane protein OmpA-like peptidoglycan-associated protein
VFVEGFDARPLASLFKRPSLPDEVTGECRENAADTRTSDSTALLGAGCTRCLGVVPIFEEAVPQLNLDIAFPKASDKIPAHESAILDKLAIALLSSSLLYSNVAVAGHTDSSGKIALNLKLSCARSLAVRAYLTQKGVASHRMTAYGFGSKRPIEGTLASAERNRRVEVRTVP